MSKVEQYDWDKLRPKQPATKYTKEPPVKVKSWVKTKRPKRIKAIDPSIREYHDNALKGLFKNL